MTLPKKYTATMASGASYSVEVVFNETYDRVNLFIPSTSGAIGANEKIYVDSSNDGENWYRQTAYEVQTAVMGSNDFRIASGISNRVVPLPYVGCNYARVALSGGVSATGNVNFEFVCHKT